ncbi:hypothetical protein TSAR_012396 [Trichomalopsis sarcophagae]|uniref:Uncharacterized protein n=1 Tax=Trichomalopsis sarcophagae TaxID=543379 RepID=A0A232F4S4_9HYME|nr:hypothetical protein TSAR_012396 [Trichomalopsis sarcophagae]
MLLFAKRRSLLLLLLLVTGIVYASIGSTGAVHAQHCKKTLRNKMFELCSGGFRNKRSPAQIDDLDPAADFASVIEESHARKRQIMSIREIIVSSRVPIPDMEYRAVPPSLWARQRDSTPPALDESLPHPRRRLEPLPQESGSHVGFDISYDEMLELYNEIYGRSGRATSDAWMAAAYECCKNEELCLIKKSIDLPCPW